MGARPDYYRLLHVQPDAPVEVIRSSYRTILRELGAHPDLGGDEGHARLLIEAWNVLSDPETRARYDAERAGAARKASAPEDRGAGNGSPSAPTDRERRALGRVKGEGRVRWTRADGLSRSSHVRDLSPRGLSFVTSADLAPGTVLDIVGPTLTARAVVRNVRPDGGGKRLVGVEFETVRFADTRGSFVSRSA